MSATSNLHELIATLASAISSAQDMVERHYLGLIRRYFDADGRPLTMNVEIPATSSTAQSGDVRQVAVPVLALVDSRALGISSVEITLDVELEGLEDDQVLAAGSGSLAPLNFLGAAELQEDSEPDPGPAPDQALAIRLPTGGSGGPTARVVLKVEERPPSEAMARLVSQLNTLI